MPNSKEVDIPHFRSIMVYLDVRSLADELGLSVYATRVLMIIAVHTYENSPVSTTRLAELWEMDAEDIRSAVGEFTMWNGYVSFGTRNKLIANFDTLSSYPLWTTYWDALLHPLGDNFMRHAYPLVNDGVYRIC